MTQMRFGPVTLRVAQLDQQVRFYEDVIGLHVRHQEGSTVHLGVDGANLLTLVHRPNSERPLRRTTGLYHFALLVPTRADLAQVLQHFIDRQTPMQGASDHFVSEALYLPDVEGNGIEIYWDRPRAAWYKDGVMQLATLPLDAQGVLRERPTTDWSGLPGGTKVGHVHLHVNDIPQAQHFYSNLLGMDVQFNVGSALFMAYDDYHHHIGANVWGGRIPAPPDALGLAHYEMRYTDAETLNAVLARLRAADIVLEETKAGAWMHDPAGNKLLLTTT